MPPQAGVFALPYKASRNGESLQANPDINMSYGNVRSPLLPSLDDPSKSSKERKRREIAGKLAKDLAEQHREDLLTRCTEAVNNHQEAARQLTAAPHLVPEYILRLYPTSLERAAALHQLALDEDYALQCAYAAWEEEKERIEEEWRKGRERIRDRMLEGIEERRKRAREDKDNEGAVADASVDPQSRPHITRKLRNKLTANNGVGNVRSPSPTNVNSNTNTNFQALANPYSLALDTLPSPFPLALPLKEPPPRRGGKQPAPSNQGQGGGKGANVDGGQPSAAGTGASAGLGKALYSLTGAKELYIEADLTELRRGARRKRQVAASMGRT
ncbi:hypothetical protein M422DRAFT_23819 [Sphaerobolus stellatus SS14]|nr:hypothetical protein M422DRAFT_23819 [Sphaerobolus stellatus SS14]